MPLVEVSVSYLAHHIDREGDYEGGLVFIEGNLDNVPVQLEVCRGLLVESSIDNVGDEEEPDEEDDDNNLEGTN
jgi:hypothetical protein